MGVCVSVLASGSRGNSAVIESSRARLLVDAGVSCRETFKRLKLGGLEPRSLSAILITHEHSDHVYGLATLAKKLDIPVFMTGGTHQAWARSLRDDSGQLPTLAKLEIFSAGRQFQIADITVMPFTIPHDAADPVGFTFHAEGAKIAFATDLGYMPASVRDHLRRCDVLILESNHDVEMLRVGPYPWSVKQRVMGRMGHLSNDVACRFVKELDTETHTVILGHLSEHNNHPALVELMGSQAVNSLFTRLLVANPRCATEAVVF
jgi:phosphoribosyl 1,2-cyclic phosphodiesterase